MREWGGHGAYLAAMVTKKLSDSCVVVPVWPRMYAKEIAHAVKARCAVACYRASVTKQRKQVHNLGQTPNETNSLNILMSMHFVRVLTQHHATLTINIHTSVLRELQPYHSSAT